MVFSGLVTAVGVVRGIRRVGSGARLTIAAVLPGEALALGESIAVDGACLTVADEIAGGFIADVSPETLTRTTLSSLRQGQRVNLERSLRLGDRLGGHLVMGHVDATTTLVTARSEGAFRRLRFALSASLAAEVVEKGSVAVCGVSLTVALLGDGWFEVAAIPATLEGTTLGDLRPGDRVNLETDVFAKYVRRSVGAGRPTLASLLEGRADEED